METLRDTAFGKLVRLFSRYTCMKYPEEQDASVRSEYLKTDIASKKEADEASTSQTDNESPEDLEAFGLYAVMSQCKAAIGYQLAWNPIAHQYSYRAPSSENWANKTTLAERYIGTTSYIDEFVGQSAAKLSIQLVEPESLGFNTTAWPEQGIETIFIGKVMIGDYSTSEFDDTSYLMHQVRHMPNGYRELRSRFFIAEKNHGSAQLGHDLAVHCNIEMTHLGSFLPAIYGEFKNTL